jgi:transketolase
MAGLVKQPFGEAVSMRIAYGEALVQIGKDREDVVVLSADVANSDHSYMFEEVFPERFFNVGIAEQSLVDVAVGFAKSGRVAIANTFAFLFATRALEQVRTHLCYGNTNVKLAGAYGGLSDSFDGPTHHSYTDLPILRSLPRMTVVVPADPVGVAKLLPKVVDRDGPAYIRLCRNEAPVIFEDGYDPKIGEGLVIRDGEDVTIIACGVILSRCLEAAEALASEGIGVRVVEMHTLKPLDRTLVERCAKETGAIVTVEEGTVIGGLGGAVAEALTTGTPAVQELVGVQDRFAETGPYADILDKYGLAVADIVKAAKTAVKRKG